MKIVILNNCIPNKWHTVCCWSCMLHILLNVEILLLHPTCDAAVPVDGQRAGKQFLGSSHPAK